MGRVRIVIAGPSVRSGKELTPDVSRPRLRRGNTAQAFKRRKGYLIMILSDVDVRCLRLGDGDDKKVMTY
ncbi:MAG: hypothetical protein CL573_07415 [Alphaproteobacteria bacterium]|nr:hypothetical protein [Alphaproteobacteria bacterium]HCP00619.1 hypothetical protein [Rhodospirillaceae bacterium]